MAQWFSWWDCGMLVLFLLALLLLYGYWQIGEFKRKGVNCLPAYPFVGNMWDTVVKKTHFSELLFKNYRAFPHDKYVGIYQFTRLTIILKDIDLLKQVAVKDFDYFQDRPNISDQNTEPLFTKNLAALKGQKWRDMRTTLSPAFTSSKMKNMFIFLDECSQNMRDFFMKKMKEDINEKNGFVEIETKDIFSKFTSDIIATSAFGIKANTLTDEDNDFFIMGNKIRNLTGVQLLKSLLLFTFPRISRKLKIRLFDESISDFFRNLVNGQMTFREQNNIHRPDMLHLLIEAKKGTLKHDQVEDNSKELSSPEESFLPPNPTKTKWDDDELVAQALLFFFAGFDTTSTLLSLMSHELALNPDIQKKLQAEVDKTMEECQGKPGYNDIQTMKYMDMVISETLRKWPPGTITDRQCVRPYTLPPSSPNGKPYKIKAGDALWIPIMAIHYDSDHYDEPCRFNPERFSDENKAKIKPFTFIPFGIGPRNCIGSRFALMQVKSVMLHLLWKFDIVATPKTTPLILDKASFQMVPVGKSWVGLKPR